MKLEGRISKQGYTDRIEVGERDLEMLLLTRFGPWQVRHDGEALPGTYRVTVERIDEKGD